jgi:hypothetical protein
LLVGEGLAINTGRRPADLLIGWDISDHSSKSG